MRSGLQADDLAVGTTWFLLGLAKKVLIADKFGPVADALYARPRSFGPHASWVGVLCYAVQLYFDFSGYSDMALGLARMFSITFPFNFNSPYKAASIIDFWQRWHMTLTRYITTYLYNPVAMGASRRRLEQGKKVGRRGLRSVDGFVQMLLWPTVFTMFIAGVWHGAGLQFILFGLAHGVYLSVNHMWRTLLPETSRWRKLVPVPVGVLLTFVCVLIGQVFFRANSAGDAVWVLCSLLGFHGAGAGLPALGGGLPSQATFVGRAPTAWAEILVACGIFWLLPNTQEILGQVRSSGLRSFVLERLRWRPNLVWTVGLLLLMAVTLTKLYQSTSFLYFQF
jgi:alginate O-acetyltransferase complex protein AlgI